MLKREQLYCAVLIKREQLYCPGIYTRRGDSIVPPQPEELARASHQDGAQRAHWRAKALGYVHLHALVTPAFLTEDVRAMAEHDGLDVPADKRAWGAVMQAAARLGYVAPDGHANSADGSPKTRWRSMLSTAV